MLIQNRLGEPQPYPASPDIASQIRPVPWFSSKRKAKKDEFQSGLKFVQPRVNVVSSSVNGGLIQHQHQ